MEKFKTLVHCRGMEDESGDQFVAYFLPNEETLRKRKREEEDLSKISNEDEYVFFEIYTNSDSKFRIVTKFFFDTD